MKVGHELFKQASIQIKVWNLDLNQDVTELLRGGKETSGVYGKAVRHKGVKMLSG